MTIFLIVLSVISYFSVIGGLMALLHAFNDDWTDEPFAWIMGVVLWPLSLIPFLVYLFVQYLIFKARKA